MRKVYTVTAREYGEEEENMVKEKENERETGVPVLNVVFHTGGSPTRGIFKGFYLRLFFFATCSSSSPSSLI